MKWWVSIILLLMVACTAPVHEPSEVPRGEPKQPHDCGPATLTEDGSIATGETALSCFGKQLEACEYATLELTHGKTARAVVRASTGTACNVRLYNDKNDYFTCPIPEHFTASSDTAYAEAARTLLLALPSMADGPGCTGPLA
ncbi:MAG: hypothetical protein OXR66_01220 [Candidatus Woesearchaeota archaeon]|nr:hypothetical protein [Candidatus Woesearchaeota archaeon]